MAISFNAIYTDMQTGWNRSWLKFLFQRTAVGRLLSQIQEPSSFEFLQAYLTSWWWVRWWFRGLFQSDEQKNKFDFIVDTAITLRNHNLFNEDNIVVVMTHPRLYELSSIFFILQNQAELFTQGNFNNVAGHEDPHNLVLRFSELQQEGLFTQDNFDVVVTHARPKILVEALCHLHRTEILNFENRVIVAEHENPSSLAKALSTLNEAGLLSDDNRTIVFEHARPYLLAKALSRLHKRGLLTDENRAIVVGHENPSSLAKALSTLHRAGLLSDDNRTIVAEFEDPFNLAWAFNELRQARLLTQDNFSALMLANHAALLTRAARDRIWNRIPGFLLTQANYQRLLTAAEHANPLEELTRVTNEIIGFVPGVAAGGAGGPAVLNPAQSTHTASIHRTVSESASKLMALYGKKLNLKKTISDIKNWVKKLEDSSKNAAAKCCIERITAPRYIHEDPRSGVSTQELLALAYIAIHDETKRQGSLEDAKDLFVEGLYEIQRGYNIDAGGFDNNLADAPICMGGTFNKIMEKLSGIHPDVEVSYITHGGASSKFPKLVQVQAIAYLKSLASPVNVADYQEIKKILETLEREKDIGCIWDKIREAVRTELWDEFKEAYSGNQNDTRFTSMIEYGGQNAVPDLSEIKAQLASSAGYQASVIEPVVEPSQASLSTQGFWALQHASGVEQQSFVHEQRYG